MKFVDEFRDGDVARRLAAAIRDEAHPARRYNLMEFCGGHTHAIFRYGIHDILPPAVNMIHGPGCPVCVLPVGCIDNAIALALEYDAIVCTYGDMLRVPGGNRVSLAMAKSRGGQVRMVYSCQDALRIATENPGRQVVFFAIGFETTTPPTALIVRAAARLHLNNFSVYCNHVLTPAAIGSILESPAVREIGTVPLDGFIGPAHVSTIIGTRPYEYFADEYRKPVVIAGFEPLDILQAILMLVRQVNEGRHAVENEYRRAVTRDGNLKAQQLVADVFELRRLFEWRGLGRIPYSALRIKSDYAAFDAERRFGLSQTFQPEKTPCRCGAVIRGVIKPPECPMFGAACTPENPMGSCMVSAEGACAAYYTYRPREAVA